MKVTYEHKPAMTFIGFSTSIRPEEGYQKCPEFWDKEYAQKNKDRINAYHREYIKRPETLIKQNCRKMVQLALQFGMLIRPNHCSKCGKEAFTEAHHMDYTKPLDVDWLCKQCHENEHHLNEGGISLE